MKSTLINVLCLTLTHINTNTHTRSSTLPHHTLLLSETFWVVPPTPLSLTHKVAVCGGDISKTVYNVGMHLRMKRFPTLGHGSTCMLQLVKRLMRCFHRAISHWCAERSGEAEPHVWELDGRTDEETEGGSECTLSGCREKLFFFQPFFLLAHRQSVWDLVWSVSVRSLQSPHNAGRMHTARDTEPSIRWNNGEPARKERTYTWNRESC